MHWSQISWSKVRIRKVHVWGVEGVSSSNGWTGGDPLLLLLLSHLNNCCAWILVIQILVAPSILYVVIIWDRILHHPVGVLKVNFLLRWILPNFAKHKKWCRMLCHIYFIFSVPGGTISEIIQHMYHTYGTIHQLRLAIFFIHITFGAYYY